MIIKENKPDENPQRENNPNENVNNERENRNSNLVEIKLSRKFMRKNNNSKYFSCWDTFCFTRFILNERRRNFVYLMSDLIYKKLSVEYILEQSTNLELLKKKLLNEEEVIEFNKLPHLTIKELMEEFNKEN